MQQTPALQRDFYLVLVTTFVISLFLSWTQVLSDPIINKDGIIYIQSAHFISLGDWITASKLYNWLLYPTLIASLSQLLNIGLETSAHLWNGLFTATTCCLFVALVQALGGHRKRILWFAALVVLCYPKLNQYRDLIIRDHGYWTFYLLTALSFFKLYEHVRTPWLVLFACSAVLATLFRTEGLLLLIGLSLILIWHHRSMWANLTEKQKKSIWIIIGIIIVSSILMIATHYVSPKSLGKLNQFFHYFDRITVKYNFPHSSLEITRDYINTLTAPRTHSEGHAALILSTTVLSIWTNEILDSIGWLYCLIILWGLIKKPLSNNRFASPLFMLLILNGFILLAFTLARFFLTGRYPVPFALTALLFIPFILDRVYVEYWREDRQPSHQRWVYAFSLLWVLTSLDSLISLGADKTYLKAAGYWIREHTESSQQVFSNHAHVIYYAGHKPEKPPIAVTDLRLKNLIENNKLVGFDYLAIEVSRRDENAELFYNQSFERSPVQVFSNKRGDRVLIYQQ